ncbi:MAG: flagellar hook-basal body protein [Opitutae bacterium]
MNIGLYQSASSLSALERWQDVVSQNITSSQATGYRKRTVNFSAEMAGEIQPDSHARLGRDRGTPSLFPRINTGVNFDFGENLPTQGNLDIAIQGDGFFAIQRPDGSKAYTRSGAFQMRLDRTIVTSGGDIVLSSTDSPMLLRSEGGTIVVDSNGSISQGGVPIAKFSVVQFADNSRLRPISGGSFLAPDGVNPEKVKEPALIQGYLEGSNTSSLREMVDMVLISRAYEANQKIISTVDEAMGKTLEALG